MPISDRWSDYDLESFTEHQMLIAHEEFYSKMALPQRTQEYSKQRSTSEYVAKGT